MSDPLNLRAVALLLAAVQEAARSKLRALADEIEIRDLRASVEHWQWECRAQLDVVLAMEGRLRLTRAQLAQVRAERDALRAQLEQRGGVKAPPAARERRRGLTARPSLPRGGILGEGENEG